MSSIYLFSFHSIRSVEIVANCGTQILDEDPSLHFALLRLQLIELIRTSASTPEKNINPALEFATSELAPRAPTNPQYLDDLEKTLSLLIFPSDNLDPSLAPLLSPDLRKDIASRVNEAILQGQGARKEARLRNLVKLRAWAERKAREAKKDIPEKLDLDLVDDGGKSASQNGNTNDTEMANNGDVDPMVS